MATASKAGAPVGGNISGGRHVGGGALATPWSTVRNAGLDELAQIESFVRAAGYGPDRIRIDPSVVRGLEYYTGPVFEAELTFEVRDDDGRPVRFGSVGGGGRYDGLVARFRGGARAGDRLFDRRLAAACGFARDQKPDRRGARVARPCRRARARP